MSSSSNSRPGAEVSRRGGLRQMTIFGIEVRLDLSVAIIFGLIVFSLGASLFPEWHPDWSPAISWSTAFLAGLLFFASLLAHELSHSLVARRYGIHVPRITLFIFGGMAEIEREAETPSSEFAIAIAGPLMSLALSFVFSLVATALVGADTLRGVLENVENGMAGLTPLATACVWLSSVNLMLAIFNMVPGFPLDGGRVFRALVWRVSGDRLLATRYAATAGKWFGWVIMGLGLWELLVLKSSGGLWLMLIGWFLSHLATASYTQTLTQRFLEPLTVGDLMRTHFERVDGSLPLARFVDECLLRSNQTLWPVVEGGRTVGAVTMDDVLALDPDARQRVEVADVMTRLDRLTALAPTETAIEASVKLAAAGDQPLAVVASGEIVGLLRGSDVLRWMMLHRERAR